MDNEGIGEMLMSANSDQFARLTDLAQLTVNPNGERAMTYVVDSVVDAYNFPPTSPIEKSLVANPLHITIAENITLIFKGGQIAVPSPYTSLTIEGNHTAIQAPMDQIFGGKVEVVGTWDMKKAYPQWFDQRAGKDALKSMDFHDCSPAINKAARMKMVGEVSLPAGNYFISNPIKLPIGIKLIGEGLSTVNIVEHKLVEVEENGEKIKKIQESKTGISSMTAIIPLLSLRMIQTVDGIRYAGTWPGKAFVEINYKEGMGEKEEDWEVSYPRPAGMISDIYFYNTRSRPEGFPISKEDESEIISRIPCCYVAGTYTFQNLLFYGFRRSIKWSDKCYSDQKYVRNCSFFLYENTLSEDMDDDICYAIDAGYLGEALCIERCHVQGFMFKKIDGVTKRIKFFNALKVSNCKGGSVDNNIFNCDVHFYGCQGVVYESNHMEDGAQVLLVGCDMSVRNNYFDKVYEPSIVIAMGNPFKPQEAYEQSKDSNLEISGNTFMIYRPIKVDKTGKEYDRFPASELSEFDIALDKTGGAPYTIHLCQNYRYVSFDIRYNQPTGIMLCTFFRDPGTTEISYDSFVEFNSRSYYLSTESVIMPYLQIRSSRIFDEISTLLSFNNIESKISVSPTTAILDGSPYPPNIPSENKEWKYCYDAQLIIDAERGIQSEIVSVIGEVCSDENGLMKYGQKFKVSFTPPKSCCILKLYRRIEYTNDNNQQDKLKSAVVEIPVIGTLTLYDNNCSVNGYEWKLIRRRSDSSGHGESIAQWLEYRDDNVRCFLKNNSLPAVAGWKEYDEVITPNGDVYFLRGDEWVKIN